MSHTASFLSDTLFPGLLIGCGCLGLVVVNFISHHPTGSPNKRTPQNRARRAQDQLALDRAPDRARPATAQGVQAPGPPGRASGPRVASLQRRPRPTVHHVAFAKGRTQVTDSARELLRVFVAAAKPGADARVTVVGHGAGAQGRRRARQRAERVMAFLRQLGVVGSIAESKVAPKDGDARGQMVTITIGKR